MSAKNVDRHNRFRSITVGFRVSPEEQEELNRAVALSGLPKQEYCYRKCMGREVVVQPNPRVSCSPWSAAELSLDDSSLGAVTGACHAPVAGRQGKALADTAPRISRPHRKIRRV